MTDATRFNPARNARVLTDRPAVERQPLNTLSRAWLITAILVVALVAFELFNFDTTRYALDNLLGDVRFAGVRWATILAVAFCGIDFAGLLRIFTPDDEGEQGRGAPQEVWYLMGAWLLGATMNAVMTWYAVALTLSNHAIGNELISAERLLQIVPVFVAVLVWLTRILFIGALSLAGGQLAQGQARSTARAADLDVLPVSEDGLPTLVAEPVRARRTPVGGAPTPRPAPPIAPPAVIPATMRPGDGRGRPNATM